MLTIIWDIVKDPPSWTVGNQYLCVIRYLRANFEPLFLMGVKSHAPEYRCPG
jgi:hypothetical protein